MDRSITGMQQKVWWVIRKSSGRRVFCKGKYYSPHPALFHFSALQNREQLLPVLWLPKHYHFHITVLLLCVIVIRKIGQHACMKCFNQLINVTVLLKNCMASVKPNTLKSTLSLNSLSNSYLIITKHSNCTKCKVHYRCSLSLDTFHQRI